jgi:hypothetical protein
LTAELEKAYTSMPFNGETRTGKIKYCYKVAENLEEVQANDESATRIEGHPYVGQQFSSGTSGKSTKYHQYSETRIEFSLNINQFTRETHRPSTVSLQFFQICNCTTIAYPSINLSC